MKNILFLLIIIGFFNIPYFLRAQGGADIVYISIDSLEKNFIGKEIRIDFRASINDTIQGKVGGIKLSLLCKKRNKVDLKIGEKIIPFYEHWRLYDDDAVLRKQSLVSADKDQNQKIEIKEMFLKNITKKQIIVETFLYLVESNKIESEVREGEFLRKEKMTLDRSIIKGILVRYTDF